MRHLIEVAEDLASNVFSAGLLVIHDTRRGGKNHVAVRTSRKHVRHPALNLGERNAETRRHNPALVDTAIERDNNLASAVVIDNVELADVA